jgi:hypothetical protein
VTFSPDGQRVVTASEDAESRVNCRLFVPFVIPALRFRETFGPGLDVSNGSSGY